MQAPATTEIMSADSALTLLPHHLPPALVTSPTPPQLPLPGLLHPQQPQPDPHPPHPSPHCHCNNLITPPPVATPPTPTSTVTTPTPATTPVTATTPTMAT